MALSHLVTKLPPKHTADPTVVRTEYNTSLVFEKLQHHSAYTKAEYNA